ncbi:MAG: hypothetical protein ACRCYY_19295 [Trueperaceae bacterium]
MAKSKKPKTAKVKRDTPKVSVSHVEDIPPREDEEGIHIKIGKTEEGISAPIESMKPTSKGF